MRRFFAVVCACGFLLLISTAQAEDLLNIKPEDYSNRKFVYSMEKLAESGNLIAQYQLCLMYTAGERGLPVNPSVAFEWCEKAAMQGHFSAVMWLGMAYFKGYGVPKDLTKARFWFGEAALRGSSLAQYLLGSMHVAGMGGVVDLQAGCNLLHKAAEQGEPLAADRYKNVCKK